MTVWGGVFREMYYRADNGDGHKGSLRRFVNCMDQAAMLELSCSLWSDLEGSFASWLVQSPFGYIHQTHLVGVTQQDFSGPLILVNNPFFGTDRTRALLSINDTARTPFSCHVYVGYKKHFDRQNDAIFDACSGPHTGTENAPAYVTAAIDTQTTLYATTHTHPGNVGNIQEGDGVTAINNTWPPTVGAPGSFDLTPFRNLVNRLAPAPASVGSVTQADWANIGTWLKAVLGNTWNVAFESAAASERIADAFWHLTDSAHPAEPVTVHVLVESVPGRNGALDVTASAEAARERVVALVASTDRNPEDLWAKGTFDAFGDYSIQYAANIAAGRVIVVAANAVVDISGRSSTNALAGIARTLLEHTVRRNAPPLAFPVLQYQGDGDSTTVRGVYTAFSAVFSVVGQVSFAGATSEDSGVLLDKYEITEVAGGNSTVEFKFVTKEIGTHSVRIHCADKLTMVSATTVVKVVVVAAAEAQVEAETAE